MRVTGRRRAASPVPGAAGAWVGAAAIGAGVLLERWLFFARAEHVVRLYHGQASV
jgi:DMSO reductase anchor subunit